MLVVFVLENRILSDQSTLKRPTWSPTTKNAKTDYITDTDAFAENMYLAPLFTDFVYKQTRKFQFFVIFWEKRRGNSHHSNFLSERKSRIECIFETVKEEKTP